MSFTEVILLALSLALDAFAVSISCGSNGSLRGRRESVRLAFHFGIFQALMPVIGWFVGYSIKDFVIAYDHWLALVMLSAIGAKMLYEAFTRSEEEIPMNAAKGWTMVSLSVATSIDALIVGVTLAFLRINVYYPAVIIGIITSILSLIGIKLGRKLNERFGKIMEFVGGIVLILLGVKILLEHIL
ncbi:MAG: manganese efflux pump MntP family protein [Ignavibacteria bacterium]|nr:manganese efflux pump MntP family protein [Ignavibacteria bacterium]